MSKKRKEIPMGGFYDKKGNKMYMWTNEVDETFKLDSHADHPEFELELNVKGASLLYSSLGQFLSDYGDPDTLNESHEEVYQSSIDMITEAKIELILTDAMHERGLKRYWENQVVAKNNILISNDYTDRTGCDNLIFERTITEAGECFTVSTITKNFVHCVGSKDEYYLKITSTTHSGRTIVYEDGNLVDVYIK